MIFRILEGDGTIVKVLFAMSKVLMSLTGEVVCEELMNAISKIRTFPGNAKSNIVAVLLKGIKQCLILHYQEMFLFLILRS